MAVVGTKVLGGAVLFSSKQTTVLFDSMPTNDFHILHSLLPPESTASQNYSLRPRVHNLQLPDHPNHLADSNFIVRILFRNVY